MRIGITTSVIAHGKSGVGQHVLALTRALTRYRNRYQFVVFVLEEDLPLFSFAEGRMEIVPVSEEFRPPVKDIRWHQFALPAIARKLELDVLHVPSYRRMLWRQPCAMVATIHDLAPFRMSRKYDWKRTLYAKCVVRFLARRQHEIITVSEHTAQDVRHYFGVPAERIHVIHNGVDRTRFGEGSREAAKSIVQGRHGLKNPFFLYVARLEHPAKNHLRLIEAFNQFKAEQPSDWQLVFAGGDWHGAEAIHDAIHKSMFASDIHSLGFVADADLPALMQAAEVFVYPSLYEGFGMPPIEAMACGCPVICSDRGALREVVDDAAAIVNPDDPRDIARQMTRLACDPEMRRNWIASGRERAKRFDWNRNAAMTLRIYERAVAKATHQPVPTVLEDLMSPQ